MRLDLLFLFILSFQQKYLNSWLREKVLIFSSALGLWINLLYSLRFLTSTGVSAYSQGVGEFQLLRNLRLIPSECLGKRIQNYE